MITFWSTQTTVRSPDPARTSRFGPRSILLVLLALAWNGSLAAQSVGDCVRMKSVSAKGVPVHSRAENSFTGNYLPDASIAKVLEVDTTGRWFRLEGVQSITGWVVEKYIGGVVPCVAGGTPAVGAATSIYRIATWNLEHFHEGADRGFPEYVGANALPSRTNAEYQYIAGIIKTLELKIVILQEINGEERTDADGESIERSDELDLLLGALGSGYAYEIASSGDAQRIALLWDTRAVFLNWSCEATFPNAKVNGKGIFDRQPLLGYFTFFSEGQEMNDLVVVGVHLASGQHLTTNHDRAMSSIQDWITASRSSGSCIPANEVDVLIAGDFNANRFDTKLEVFWDDMESGPYDVLADSGSGYAATRLSGQPPEQRTSVIDYIIVSDGPGGLMGNEVSSQRGVIHNELITAAGDGMAFRRKASDHLPVTVDIQVTADLD